jgi:hypothetical protein
LAHQQPLPEPKGATVTSPLELIILYERTTEAQRFAEQQRRIHPPRPNRPPASRPSPLARMASAVRAHGRLVVAPIRRESKSGAR